MFATLSVFLDFNLPNATTWFYFSFLLAIALFFKFGRLLSVRNADVIMMFLLVPGLLVMHGAQARPGLVAENPAAQAVALIGQCSIPTGATAVVARTGFLVLQPQSAFEASRWLWVGYLWLICGSGYFFCRCLFDLALVQRPALSPNLTFGGLAWLAGALLICLMAVAFRPYERVLSPVAGPPAANVVLPEPTTVQGTPDFLLQQVFDPPGWVYRLVAVLCHVAVLIGLVVIGWQHFGDASSGMAAATFYLMLPYTGLVVGQASQAWPAALLVWTIAAYRYPTLAGLLLGLATGTALFPLVLLPTWTSFYGGRGVGRFLLAWSLAVGLCIVNGVLILNEGDLPLTLQESLLAWLPWRVPATEGFWTGIHAAYRLPVFIAYLALVLATTVWPSPKNLAQVLALSTAALVGLQFWYADQGGVYVLWYAPLLLLLAFRPNLQEHRPPAISRQTDWLARLRDATVRTVRRLARIPEPAQIHRG